MPSSELWYPLVGGKLVTKNSELRDQLCYEYLKKIEDKIVLSWGFDNIPRGMFLLLITCQ